METLLEEFKAREFLHKVAIVGGAIMHNYMEEEKAKGGAQLPDFIIEEKAQAYSDRVIQKAMAMGTLNKLYEEGVQLSEFCMKKLDNAKQKAAILMNPALER